MRCLAWFCFSINTFWLWFFNQLYEPDIWFTLVAILRPTSQPTPSHTPPVKRSQPAHCLSYSNAQSQPTNHATRQRINRPTP